MLVQENPNAQIKVSDDKEKIELFNSFSVTVLYINLVLFYFS